MLQCQYAIAMQQQDSDAHELLDFDQGNFIIFVTIILRAGGGQPGEVGECFAPFLRQRWRVTGSQTESSKKSAAPIEQCPTAFGQRCIGCGLQQFERKTAVVQLPGADLVQTIKHAIGDDRGDGVVCQYLGQPIGRRRSPASKPTAQRTVQFGGIDGHIE